MQLLTVTNPKKAKYGFKCESANRLLDVGMLVRETLGTPPPPHNPQGYGSLDPWWEVVDANMGQVKLLMYFNDEELYKRLLAANNLT